MKYNESIDFLKPQDMADATGLTKYTIYVYIRNGKIPYYTVNGKIIRVKTEDFNQFLKARKKAPLKTNLSIEDLYEMTFTVDELANLLKVYKTTILNLIHNGTIEAVKIGKTYAIEGTELKKLKSKSN